MKMTVILTGVACALLFVAPVECSATIYWTPAHELAPQGHICAMSAGDLDADGDYDLALFCGEPMKQWWNIGTPTEPVWQLGPSPYEGVPTCVAQNGGLGDLDADGDLDLVVTCWYDDFVRFYWNVGTPSSPSWEADLSVFDGVPTSGGDGCPRLADMDGDGDLDAMLGSWSGMVRYARNVGTASAPSYEYVGWVDNIPYASGGGPTFALGDLDSDGDLDIVRVSDDDTPPECFENVGTSSAFEFVVNEDMLAGLEYPSTGRGMGVELMDIDADGDPDLILAVAFEFGNLLFLNEGVTPVESTSWGLIKAMYR